MMSSNRSLPMHLAADVAAVVVFVVVANARTRRDMHLRIRAAEMMTMTLSLLLLLSSLTMMVLFLSLSSLAIHLMEAPTMASKIIALLATTKLGTYRAAVSCVWMVEEWVFWRCDGRTEGPSRLFFTLVSRRRSERKSVAWSMTTRRRWGVVWIDAKRGA